ncbi:hypothetical protein [Streptomyces sp. NPDC059874]|uniref:hypothetical protein n=1 Tax=Streptomyces sp. NPDC059874 TaxID=3346983 RepID=UPI003657EA91
MATGIAGVLAGIAGTIGVLAVTGEEDEPKAAATFTLTGNFLLAGYGDYVMGSNGCKGKGGYNDIAAGASVIVKDDKGATVATSSLPAGNPQSSGCVFAISVPNVPGDRPFYAVEISHRGSITATADEAKSGKWFASLGD